jgi:SAM-dependent methyltransferase
VVFSTKFLKFVISRVHRVATQTAREGITPVIRPYITSKGRTQRPDNFDETWGVETKKPVRLFELTFIGGNEFYASSYEASPPGVPDGLISGLDIQYEDFSFVDLGSGKGRVLLVASQFPFKKIIGVEFSPELVETSLRNIEAAKRANRRCDNIDVCCKDAADYIFPGENLVVYLYYPFDGKVMRKVIENLRLCLEKYRRRIIVVYVTPTCADLLDREHWLKREPGHIGAAVYRSDGFGGLMRA